MRYVNADCHDEHRLIYLKHCFCYTAVTQTRADIYTRFPLNSLDPNLDTSWAQYSLIYTMGVPHLTTYLSSYNVSMIIGCERPDCQIHTSGLSHQNTKLVIDGPSFAYEVYNRAIADKSTSLDIVNAVPGYSEIEKSALTLLAQLEGCGLKMYEHEWSF